MKNLFVILITLLLSTSAVAQSGFFYNPERDGEGISVVIDGDTVAFALYTYWDATHAVPPIVSPAPPPAITPCHNCAIWYVGTGEWMKDSSTGKMYMSVPIDYPHSIDGNLDVQFSIGTYLLTTGGEGYKLSVFCNDVVPSELYMCNNDFNFYRLLIGD